MSLHLRLAIPIVLLITISLTAQEDVEWIDQQPCGENEAVSPNEAETQQTQPNRTYRRRRCRLRLFCRRPCYWQPAEASWPSKLDDSFFDELSR